MLLQSIFSKHNLNSPNTENLHMSNDEISYIENIVKNPRPSSQTSKKYPNTKIKTYREISKKPLKKEIVKKSTPKILPKKDQISKKIKKDIEPIKSPMSDTGKTSKKDIRNFLSPQAKNKPQIQNSDGKYAKIAQIKSEIKSVPKATYEKPTQACLLRHHLNDFIMLKDAINSDKKDVNQPVLKKEIIGSYKFPANSPRKDGYSKKESPKNMKPKLENFEEASNSATNPNNFIDSEKQNLSNNSPKTLEIPTEKISKTNPSNKIPEIFMPKNPYPPTLSEGFAKEIPEFTKNSELISPINNNSPFHKKRTSDPIKSEHISAKNKTPTKVLPIPFISQQNNELIIQKNNTPEENTEIKRRDRAPQPQVFFLSMLL